MQDDGKLVVHSGGWTATESEVNGVEIPERTNTYTPIPHGRVIEHLHKLLPQHGMKLDRLKLALSNAGKRMFGLLIKADSDISRSSGVVVDQFDVSAYEDHVEIQGMAEGIMIGNTIEIDYTCLDLIVSRLRQEGKL